jgi:hypothetical protein
MHVMSNENKFPLKNPESECVVLAPRRPDSACPAHTLPRTHLLALGRGCLRPVAAVITRRRHVSHLVTGPGGAARAWSPAWDTVAGGSLQWLPAREGDAWMARAACQNSRYLHGQTRALALRVWPERHLAQSSAIALRSPASERPSEQRVPRYSLTRLQPWRARLACSFCCPAARACDCPLRAR